MKYKRRYGWTKIEEDKDDKGTAIWIAKKLLMLGWTALRSFQS